ncbi:MAG: glutamine--tRNA ligase/YqeY domain fusion protein [Candidatus Marinimicrobia bacterium]|jgi:glutaminyl-tRNA synthetase|nr:glutamine--tRNA ligase/YqeY domain fusion protein [Candidatus Neomarinimicrobiota bacterium]MBT3937086.1 glutamine--tRNA ligase/YqeY domain fusion protein [Candidatus Neomarinimicrobiota bacterium]MBT3962056.1 glutamine--tRNA ligase/YqeY domain fusion protein [Candidatus Neomarinimicrobiota bacterium]MBT4382424.1 glutamine--tRNA ligase/YqeY domain fusion protein [Candidatus Neomarinimicrobiota bacterium]MBT4636541.1 glutamine--tRNA ligase/YqeY domain fusion protein [Candidatus Neomarinimicro
MEAEKPYKNFIQKIIDEDNLSGKFNKNVHTRFPPEPNGYLHIGHAKSICLNFGLAHQYNGLCNLRFDDTNPIKEEDEYVKAIIEDVSWLGFDWGDRLFYASDYFDQMYEFAVFLIQSKKAYVCDLSADEVRATRGNLKEAGTDSPFRERTVDESLLLFTQMKNGDFEDGSRTLRAKIDMSHPNLNMRDPVMYRILKANHHRTGDKWCIYPMYDWAHGLEDSLEGITHSICTLEFEDHRLLYDWYLNQLDTYHPQQIEFARLNLNFTIMSKRWLKKLVDDGYVSGWDDPRMPTISGLRRRGYTPESIRNFAEKVGVAKRDNVVEMNLLEHSLREDLNKKANRVMGVIEPLKIVITNFPENEIDYLEAINNPEDESAGKRRIAFTKEIYIERSDFMEEPFRKYFRLAPGREVRLRYAFYITCVDVIKNSKGQIIELHCTYDPETRGGSSPDGRKVKGTIHWVSSTENIEAEVRLYDRLFLEPNPSKSDNINDTLNIDSLVLKKTCFIETEMKKASVGEFYQFERLGYFSLDNIDSSPEHFVFNRSVALRDSWKKIEKGFQTSKIGCG